MPSTSTIEDFPGSEGPHRSFGSGKIIRPDSYGHVEVSVTPRRDPADVTVEWNVIGPCIPPDQRELIITASHRILDAVAKQGRLRSGVRLVIEGGSYHATGRSAHTDAAEAAVIDALQRGSFLRKGQHPD